jgi:hypothetical protein
MMINRRLALTAVAGGAAAGVVACSPQQVADIEKQVAAFINDIQGKVKAACAAAGALVPTANSVMAIIQAVAGSTNPAVVTATMIENVIAEIVAAGCPPPGAVSSPTTVRGVKVEFYP